MANWLTGWLYRQKHDIGGTTGAGTGYQMKYHVYKGPGTSSGNVIYCNNHCQNDFGDIRFCDSSGNALLNYFIEPPVNSGSDAFFWIQVAASLESGTVSIYIYYGNGTTQTTTSSGPNTFPLFFEDFNSLTTGALDGQDGWSNAGGTSNIWQVETSVVYEGAKAAGATDINNNEYCSKNMSSNPTSCKIIYFARKPALENYGGFQLTNDASAKMMYCVFLSSGYFDYYSDQSGWVVIGSYTINTWYRVESQLRRSDYKGRHNMNNGAFTSWDLQYGSITWNAIQSIIIMHYQETGTYFDLIFAAKLPDSGTDPNDSTWYAEESSGTPASNDLSSSFTVRKSTSANMSSSITLRKSSSTNLSSSFTVGHSSSQNLSSSFYIKSHASKDLSSSFTLPAFIGSADLSSNFFIAYGYARLHSSFTIRTWRDLSSSFTVNNTPAAANCSGSFTVRGKGTADLSSSFSIRRSGAVHRPGSFTIRRCGAANSCNTVTIRNKASKDLLSSFTVYGVVAADLSSSFYVPPHKDVSSSFVLRRSFMNDLSSSFYVAKMSSQDLSSSFRVVFHGAANLSCSLIPAKVSANLPSSFTVQLIAVLPSSFSIRKTSTRDVCSSMFVRNAGAANSGRQSFTVRGAAKTDLSSSFLLRQPNARDLTSKFIILRAPNLSGSFTVRTLYAQDFPSSVTIRTVGTKNLPSKFSVNRPFADLSSSFGIASYDHARLRSNVTVRNRGAADLSSSFSFVKTKDLSSSFTIVKIPYEYVELTSQPLVNGDLTSNSLARAELSCWSEGQSNLPS